MVNLLQIETQLDVIVVGQKYILNATTWIMLTLNIFSFLIKHGIGTIAKKFGSIYNKKQIYALSFA